MASFQSSHHQEGNNQPDDGTTLFLGDLSVYSTENHIRELFQPYGKIENVRIKRGNTTKPHLCYGFIKFENKACAERALNELNGVMFLGRTLRVGWAEKKAQMNNNNAQGGNPQQQPRSNQGNNNVGNLAPKVGGGGGSKGIETAQIHVSFISKQIDALISESTLRSLFGLYGEVVDVAIKKSQFDKKLKLQNGYGFVHYRLDDQGIHSAINATSAIHQVTIDRVTYDCSLSHSLEVIMQQQGYTMPSPAVAHNEASNTDQPEGEEPLKEGEGEHGEEANYHIEQVADTSAINSYQPANPATAVPVDSAAAAAFPMLQAPVVDPANTAGHYQIQNADANYAIPSKDLNTTLEFFPNFQQPGVDGGFAPPLAGAFPHPHHPHLGNPFQAPLSYGTAPGAPPHYANFQLGMFYPPGAPVGGHPHDFGSHLFPGMSASPMPHNASFYDDKGMLTSSSSFHLNKPFDGLVGGLGGINLGAGGFDASAAGHPVNGLSEYPAQNAPGMPFPSLHNPFQTTAFEPIMFPSLSTGITEDGSTAGAPHFNHPPPHGHQPPQHF